VGPDDDEVRTGNAMIIDCYGRIINETWKAQDEMVIGELDMSLQQTVQAVDGSGAESHTFIKK